MTVTGRAIARAGLIVTAAFFASRVLGWLRLAIIGTQFGASPDLDAYFAAFRIPDAIFQFVAAGALASALIPVLTGLLAAGEDARAWRVVSTIANLMLLALLVLAGAFALAAPLLMPAITPGFDAAQTARTVELTRIMLLSPVFLALGAVATSVLNTLGRFGASALGPILYNLGIIAGAVFLAPLMGVGGLAVGVVLGAIGHLAVQVPPLRGRMRYAAAIDPTDPAARQTFLLLVPRTIGLAAGQITFLVNTSFASGLATGAITAYNVAFTVLQIPIGLVGVPLGVVLLPSMAQAIAGGATARFADLVLRSLRLIAFVMLPLTGLMMVLRREGVALLFESGRFDAKAVELTADALLVFLVGLTAHAMIAILAPAFYAGKDTRTPVLAAVLAVGVNVAIAALTVGSLGLRGLALAIAAGAWLEVGVLLLLLRRRAPEVALGRLARGTAVFAGGALLAAGVALFAARLLDPLLAPGAGKAALLVGLALAGTAATASYVAYAAVLRIPELLALASLLRDALGRRRGRA